MFRRLLLQMSAFQYKEVLLALPVSENRKVFALANSCKGMKSSMSILFLPRALYLHICPWLWQLPGMESLCTSKTPQLPRKPWWHLKPWDSSQGIAGYIGSCLPGEPVLHMNQETASSIKLEKATSFCMMLPQFCDAPAAMDPHSLWTDTAEIKGKCWLVVLCPPAPLSPGTATLPNLPGDLTPSHVTHFWHCVFPGLLEKEKGNRRQSLWKWS